MVDRYTKTVLTVIAVALVGLLGVRLTPSAEAQGMACGSSQSNPCFVANYGMIPVSVHAQ